MKKQIPTCLIYLFSVALWLIAVSPVVAQSAMFVYQGRLTQAGNAVTGIYDLQFKLFDSANVGTGAQQGGTISNSVPVTNGVFTVALDFGAAVFDGSPRFLEIGVRSGSASPYNTLAPRQQVTSIPYAIHSLDAATAATALNVTSGSAVKSLNTLKDDVTLAAGPNVTITPSGNTLTIASAGVGGSSLWSLNGADAYYTAGNVGIGTAALTNGVRLEVNGGALFTPGGSGGTIQLGTPSAETGMTIKGTNRADVRFDGAILKLVAGAGRGAPLSENGIAINTSGNVGIGTTTPTSKLEIAAQDGLAITGYQPFLTLRDTGAGNARTAIQTVGGGLSLLSESALSGASPSALLWLANDGNVGIGTTAPIAKLDVKSSATAKTAVYGSTTGGSSVGVRGSATGGSSVGVYGNATAASSVGVWGSNPNGIAVYADGNAAQARDKGGLVKAMIYVDPGGGIVRCYNGITDQSTGNCGFTVTHPQTGYYQIDFNFRVDDRFVSVTPLHGGSDIGVGAEFYFDTTGKNTEAGVRTFLTGLAFDDDQGFMIIVY